MFLRGDFWHYDFVIGGIRYRGSTGYKKHEKDKARAEEERLRVQAREKHSIEMVWEQTKKRMISSNSLEFDEDKVWKVFSSLHSSACQYKMSIYHGYWKSIHKSIHEAHPDVRYVSDVTSIHAIEWYGELRKRTLADTTRNAYISFAKLLFNTLGKTYGIIENPFAELKPLPKNAVTRDAYTPEELKKIGAYAEGWVYSLCLTAISTGLRKGDICMMKKESVDMENRILSVKTRKTGVTVEIPILPGLYRHFQEMFLAYPDSPYVFPELADLYSNHGTQRTITNGVKNLLHKVGIEDTEKTVEGYAHKVSTKDIHSFRHTFVYMASISGIPLPVVQSIVGHLNPEMTKHYMDHAGRDARLAYMKQLPGYITGGEAPKEINIVDEIEKRDIKKRILDLINRTSKENFERTKARILKIIC
jgi:integrase